MDIRQQLMADLKIAMRAKDTQTRNTIRLMQAAIKQVDVDSGQTVDNKGVLAILQKQAKQRREAITEYEKAGRDEMAAGEKQELAIIERYLPKQLSRAEVEAIVADVLAGVDTSDPRNMGKIMGQVMPKVKGKADGRLVNQVVRAMMSQ